MSRSKKIKTLLQEAELYRTQGLLIEAKRKYERAEEMIRAHEKLSAKPNIIRGIEKKIKDLEQTVSKLEKASAMAEKSIMKQTGSEPSPKK